MGCRRIAKKNSNKSRQAVFTMSPLCFATSDPLFSRVERCDLFFGVKLLDFGSSGGLGKERPGGWGVEE